MFVVLFEEKNSGVFERLRYNNYREAWYKYTELKSKAKHEAWFMLKGHMTDRIVCEMDSTNTENGSLVCAGYTANVRNPCSYTDSVASYYVELAQRPDWWPEDEPEG